MEIVCKVQLKKSEQVVECKVGVDQNGKTLIENFKSQLSLPNNTRASLFVNSQKCDESKPISQLIQPDSVIEIELNLQYTLKITHDMFAEKTVKVNAFDQVLDLAEKVNNLYRIKRYSIEIWFNNRPLKPHDQLYFAHVQDQQHLKCVLQARFTIEHQNKNVAFTVDPITSIGDIKGLVAEKFQLMGDFDIYYNDRILSGLEDKYFFYGVTQNAQLRISMVKNVNLQIRRDGNITNYIVNLDETIANLIQYLKKIINIEFSLKYRNQILIPGNTIKESNLSNHSILDVVTGQKQIRLILVDFDRPQLKFIDQIASGSTIQNLCSRPQFSGKVIKFYDSNKVELNPDFVIESDKQVQFFYQEISDSQIILPLIIKFINTSTQEEKIMRVFSNDQIIEHLGDVQELNRVKIKFQGTDVHPEYTFKDIGAKDNDVIIYSVANQMVRIKYDKQIHEIEIQDGTTFDKFDEILKDEFNIERDKKYQFIYKDRIQTDQIEVLAVYQDNDPILYRERKESVIKPPQNKPLQPNPDVPPVGSQIIVNVPNPVEPPKLIDPQKPIEPPKPIEPIKQVVPSQPVEPPKPVEPLGEQVFSEPDQKYCFGIYIEPWEYTMQQSFSINGTVQDIVQYIRNHYDLTENIFVTISHFGRVLQLYEPIYSLGEDSFLVVQIEG